MREKPVSMRCMQRVRSKGLQREAAAVIGLEVPSSPRYLERWARAEMITVIYTFFGVWGILKGLRYSIETCLLYFGYFVMLSKYGYQVSFI